MPWFGKKKDNHSELLEDDDEAGPMLQGVEEISLEEERPRDAAQSRTPGSSRGNSKPTSSNSRAAQPPPAYTGNGIHGGSHEVHVVPFGLLICAYCGSINKYEGAADLVRCPACGSFNLTTNGKANFGGQSGGAPATSGPGQHLAAQPSAGGNASAGGGSAGSSSGPLSTAESMGMIELFRDMVQLGEDLDTLAELAPTIERIQTEFTTALQNVADEEEMMRLLGANDMVNAAKEAYLQLLSAGAAQPAPAPAPPPPPSLIDMSGDV